MFNIIKLIMKTRLLTTAFLAGLLISCASESTSMVAELSPRRIASINFEKAITDLSKPVNRATITESESSDYPELSLRRKQMLLPAAYEILAANGFSQEIVNERTRNNTDKILSWALLLYNEELIDNKKNSN